MPVRSLNSSVLKWPDKKTVAEVLRQWVKAEVDEHPEVMLLICTGSFARDDWGPGSDLDLVMVVETGPAEWWKRSCQFDLTSLPVPADLVVYTQGEWESIERSGGRFFRVLNEESLLLYSRAMEER